MGSPCSPGIALPSRAIDPRIPLRAEAICCGKLQRAESCCCRCCFCCCFCGLLLKVSAWSELTKLVQICPSDGAPVLDSEIIARGRSQLAPSCRFCYVVAASFGPQVCLLSHSRPCFLTDLVTSRLQGSLACCCHAATSFPHVISEQHWIFEFLGWGCFSL